MSQRRGTLLGSFYFGSRISFASQNKFREEISRKSFSFGKIFPRGLSKSICKLSARAQGNPACAMIWEAGGGSIDSLGALLRELSSVARLRESPYHTSRSGGQPSSRDFILVHEFLLLRKTNSVRGGDG